MKITPVPHGLDNIGANEVGFTRTSGVHVSDIYNTYFKKVEPERFDPRLPDGSPEPMDMTRIELGMSFEHILEAVMRARLLGIRPSEFRTKEGLAFSPDQLLWQEHGLRLGEMKLTWMSSSKIPDCTMNRFPPKFDKWFMQMKAYCHNLDINTARLYVYFVNADYPRSPRPILRAFDIEFTARELRENWQFLVNFATEEGML